MRLWLGPWLVQIKTYRLLVAKPLLEPMIAFCWLNHRVHTSVKFESNKNVLWQKEDIFENVICRVCVILIQDPDNFPNYTEQEWYKLWITWYSNLAISITWWLHQMETLSAYWPFVWGIHRSPANSPHKGQLVTWSSDVSLICAWIHGSVNNRKAGDLRRHRAHYDVSVMIQSMYKNCQLLLFPVLGGDLWRARYRPDRHLPRRLRSAARAHQCILQWGHR